MPVQGFAILLSNRPKSLSSVESFTGPRTPFASKRIFSESMLLETIENAEPIIARWDPDLSSHTHVGSLFGDNREETTEFLSRVTDLRRSMDFIVSMRSYTDKLVMAQKLMLVAMRRLEKEFYEILSKNCSLLDLGSISGRSRGSVEEIGDGSVEEDASFVDDAVADLRTIADCMTSSGYGRECVKIYILMRRSVIDEGLYQLGIEMFKPTAIQKLSWIALERMIKNWLEAVPVAVETLFAGERILCDRVFSVSTMARESIFSNIAKDGALNLLRLPEMVAKTKTLAVKVYRMMDMYEVTLKLWPEIEAIFCKVMTFVSSLTAYGAILSEILSDHPLSSKFSLPESYFECHSPDDSLSSALPLHLARFMLVLLCKLDCKAKEYKDASMSYLFLATNLNYIVETVKATGLRSLLGHAWVSKHEEKVELYISSYEMIAWKKAISTLPESRCAASSVEAVKECFRKFNVAFVEAYRQQASVVILDERIRDKVKVSLAEKLAVSYRHFYETFLVMLRTERNLHLLVKFSPYDIENYISELFSGNAASA